MPKYKEHYDERLVIGFLEGINCTSYAFFVNDFLDSIVQAEK